MSYWWKERGESVAVYDGEGQYSKEFEVCTMWMYVGGEGEQS